MVTQKKGATRAEFLAFARAHGASELMTPAEIAYVEKLPLLGTGKIDNMVGAQKLSLASSVGTLSLMLRKAGEASAATSRRITPEDLSNQEAVQTDGPTRTIVVRRGGVRQEISVPVDAELQASAESNSPAAESKKIEPKKKHSAKH